MCYCNDLQAHFLVFWLGKKTSIAAPYLPATRKWGCLFCYGKGRCFVFLQRRPEVIPGLQLLIKQASRLEVFSCISCRYQVIVPTVVDACNSYRCHRLRSISHCVWLRNGWWYTCSLGISAAVGIALLLVHKIKSRSCYNLYIIAQALRHSKVMVLPGLA